MTDDQVQICQIGQVFRDASQGGVASLHEGGTQEQVFRGVAA